MTSGRESGLIRTRSASPAATPIAISSRSAGGTGRAARSSLAMFAIMTATASTLGLNKGTDITSAAQAAGALRPVAGSRASTLFALGFIGSGMLAVPVLAGAGSVGLSCSASGLRGAPL
jgi:Mn2+/Fe2+ NRAMP family transporter